LEHKKSSRPAGVGAEAISSWKKVPDCLTFHNPNVLSNVPTTRVSFILIWIIFRERFFKKPFWNKYASSQTNLAPLKGIVQRTVTRLFRDIIQTILIYLLIASLLFP
jgi:hypothetical protein